MKRTPVRPPMWAMVGARVDYHSIIGGPITLADAVVRHGPQQMPSGEWVVWLKGKSGCVSVLACTPRPDWATNPRGCTR